MAGWCALCAHFYGESIFYAGLLIFFVFLFELPGLAKKLELPRVFRLMVFVIFVVFLLGNIPAIQGFSSLILFSDMPKDGAWFSWYMHQPPAVWIGSFVAGLLMGADVSVLVVVVASIVTIFSALSLIVSRKFRVGILALIGVSLMAVAYIEITSYQYGEHKIIHLLGASWALAVVAASAVVWAGSDTCSYEKFVGSGKKIIAISLFICFVFVVSNFLSSSISLLKQMRGPHSLDFGLGTLASYIRPGDTVLVDDSQWIGVEKFFKTHYLAFQLQHQKAKVLMPSIESDHLRGGYQRNFINDTLKDAVAVDWLIKGKGHSLSGDKFVSPYEKHIWNNGDYLLYRVNRVPVIVAGNGWHDCEPEFCWTMAPFDMEVNVPSVGDFELYIDFFAFSPPENGIISVRAGDGEVLAKFSAGIKRVKLKLPKGWSRLTFRPDWSISSPKDLGMSADSRKLFAAIRRVEIKVMHRGEVE